MARLSHPNLVTVHDAGAALQGDPAVKQRRRLVAAGAITLAVAGMLAVGHALRARRAATEREVAAHVGAVDRAVASARTNVAAARDLRTRAFAAFDALDAKQGEKLWRDVIASLPTHRRLDGYSQLIFGR